MVKETDVLIIGAGPGGYPAAIRAAQLGKNVIIVDKGTIGGECLNFGCIPSKALITAANFYHKLTHDASTMGISIGSVDLDVEKLQTWKQSIQDKLIGGIKQLLKSHKVQTMIGTASFLSKNEVEVILDDGSKETVKFQDAIIATGAAFISIPGFEIDEEDILSAKGALSLQKIPDHFICIGGGIIGLELGTVYAKLGSKVTIVELLPNLMTGVEKRMVNVVRKKLKAMDVDIFTETTAESFTKKNGRIELVVKTKEGAKTIVGDKILLSIGKRAATSKIGLQRLGVKVDKGGFIEVNSKLQTNVPHIYAIGDCTGMPFLAHRATKQGIIAAEVITGMDSEADFRTIPGAIFTDPEIAFAGMNEAEAKEKGIDVHVGQAGFAASGRAMSYLETDGFARVIMNTADGSLLGVQIVGPHASDLISEAALALEMGATVEDLGFTVHPHPTLPEMIMEAAEAAEGKAIHVPNPKRRKKK